MSKVKIIPWDESSAIHIDKIYTQLSWVRDDRKASGVTQEELEDYADIFKGDKHHPNPKRLLVYGRPGIGKTTFSKKTAFDWAKQRNGILKKFDVVLLIKLRDVCDLKDIHDVLRASKLLASDEVVPVDEVYDYILHNQEKVLLILDGYDEYFCTGEQSPVRNIWEGTLLRDCHVIMTTRQEKADEVRFPSHVQFEINGFKSNDQVKAFASKILRDEEDVEEFLSSLHKKHLKGMAEIPLLLLMLCLVWKESHPRGLPKSRADIYTNFLQTLLNHSIEKHGNAKQFGKIDEHKEELCILGKVAFDALLQDCVSFPFSKRPDGILITKLIEVGLFHVLKVSSLNPEQVVHFIHKSVQEFLGALYLTEEMLKEESTALLSHVGSFEKIVKMIEVLKFACELSADAACAVLTHLGIVGKNEGLTEYNFTATPCIEDLSKDQKQFLTLISQCFFCCASDKRRDLYPTFLSFAGGVLFINSDQLHSVANEHFLQFVATPEFIFFSHGKHTEQIYRDLIAVVDDLRAVVVSRSGEKKASDFLKKYRSVDDFFLRKEEDGKLYLCIAQIHDRYSGFPTEMLRELISLPDSTQKKKSVRGQSDEQEKCGALCLTDNTDSACDIIRHSLSCVWRILISDVKRQEMETLIDVLSFVTSPRSIIISGEGLATDPVLVETMVSRINFTDRLDRLELQHINLTATPASLIATSLYQAPNLSYLNLSSNPLGEGVSDLARHLSCASQLDFLRLHSVKMTKKQVNDLTDTVRQSKIHDFSSSYHVRFESFLLFVLTVYHNSE